MPNELHGEFDLQPDPRILPMLGEINLAQWRCLAELIDNSVDAFLSAQRAEQPVLHPEVYISIPTTDLPSARIAFRDNGNGMTPETLEKAVRAGWTSNDPISNLGLFGMGFNIATARLGGVTKVWTTQAGDESWCGVEIDFDQLRSQRHFKTPRLTRPKQNPAEHGTEISIEKLKPEQRTWFAKPANKTKLIREFGVAYSAMLRANGNPLTFKLQVNNQTVKPRLHCVWGGEESDSRTVQTSEYGQINAFRQVNFSLPDRRYCTACWHWLDTTDSVCPSCGTNSSVVTRKRAVRGWLGIQRYVSDSEYGIDFLRNGRKIEVSNRDLFEWEDGGNREAEYPIDDPRHRGRIVGEIHLDHARVSYTKDRFDRNDPAWAEMLRAVRGEGPLRPQRARELGFGENASPLFLLYQAFRRHQPKNPRVPPAFTKVLAVKDNERAADMAKLFHSGDPEYQSDKRWWELVEEADRELLGGTPSTGGAGATAPDAPSPLLPPTDSTGGQLPAVSEAPVRESIAQLTNEYIEELTGQRFDVRALRALNDDPTLAGAGSPWKLTATSTGRWDFIVDSENSIFRSATLTPLDALLAEISFHAADFSRASGLTAKYGAILVSLRRRYSSSSRLDPLDLSARASEVLSEAARSVALRLSPLDGAALFGELASRDSQQILQKMASRAVSNPQEIIEQGRFLEFAEPHVLFQFVSAHPELFLDGLHWDIPFASIEYGDTLATQAAQASIVRRLLGLLDDVVWLAGGDASDLSTASRDRLLRAALALELLDASQV